MTDANTIQADISGVDPTNGNPQSWRKVLVRHMRAIGEVTGDPNRGPWNSKHNNVAFTGTYDAYEQMVGVAEQIAWRHVFSNGKTYDPGDILIGLGELLIKEGYLT